MNEIGGLADRAAIAMLANTAPPTLVHEVIDEAQARERRARTAPAWLAVYFTLALWLWPRAGYGAVWARLVDGLTWAGHLEAVTTCAASSLARARERLGPEPLQILFRRLTSAAGPDLPAMDMMMDITRLRVQPHCGFSHAYVVTMIDRGSGALVEAAWAPDSVPRDDLAGRLTCLRGGGTPVGQVTDQYLSQQITGRTDAMLRSTSPTGVAQEIHAMACLYQALIARPHACLPPADTCGTRPRR